MTIDDFLERFVEGYLLGDLRSMERVRLQPGESYGACGYSMVMVAAAGTELLGGLVYPHTFNPSSGRQHFTHYWKQFLYPYAPRVDAAGLMYVLVRNGLAHTFVTKPDVLISTHEEAAKHLAVTEAGTLRIDAHVLASDFRESYFGPFRRHLATQHGRDQAQSQLDALIQAYGDETRIFEPTIRSLPVAPPQLEWKFIPSGEVHYEQHIHPSGYSPVNSPTVASNVIRVGRDDDRE